MRILVPGLQVLAVIFLIGGALLALTSGSPFEHDRPSANAMIKGTGILDGLTFATDMAPQGKSAAIRDAMFFSDGQFLSHECEARSWRS